MAILKTGLIGAGVFGGYHAGKIAASDRTKFVGLFDPDAARCADLAAKQGVEAFASQADLFAAADAVIVACPATYHEAVVRSALEAGCQTPVGVHSQLLDGGRMRLTAIVFQDDQPEPRTAEIEGEAANAEALAAALMAGLDSA